MILSYGYWQRRFGGDREVLGRTIVIDFVPHQVIGVMPRNFRFVNLAPDMLLPQRFPEIRPDRTSSAIRGIARLKPGVTIALANQDLARVWKIWGETDGGGQDARDAPHQTQPASAQEGCGGRRGLCAREF